MSSLWDQQTLALQHADTVGSTLVVANDPDADRFCAAEKVDGQWKVFTGDQLGTLFGAAVLEKYKASGRPMDKLAMCASTVSSKMLRAIALREGFQFHETLTGFKYLGNQAQVLSDAGFACPFQYEEAIGFALSEEVRDKDGVSALVVFCELATRLAHEGQTISGYLDALYDKYGYFETSNSYVISRDKRVTDRIFHKLRHGDQDPAAVAKDPKERLSLPKTLAGHEVTYLRDLTVGFDSSTPDKEPLMAVDPNSHMISFAVGSTGSGDGVEVTGTVRTSGTEPKIKWYCEGSGQDRVAVREKLDRVVAALVVEWLQADAEGLQRAQA